MHNYIELSSRSDGNQIHLFALRVPSDGRYAVNKQPLLLRSNKYAPFNSFSFSFKIPITKSVLSSNPTKNPKICTFNFGAKFKFNFFILLKTRYLGQQFQFFSNFEFYFIVLNTVGTKKGQKIVSKICLGDKKEKSGEQIRFANRLSSLFFVHVPLNRKSQQE